MNKLKSYEIEVRGPLDKAQFYHLAEVLSREGEKKGQKNRLILDYSDNLGSKSFNEREIDLRLRSTNSIPEIILKLGKWGAKDARDEISITTERGSFDKLVEFFGAIGFKRAILCERDITQFDYNDVEFSLINISDKYYTFEAEILVGDQKAVDPAREKIEQICADLHLKIFSNEEFFNFVAELNKKVNKKFDFDMYSAGFFKEKYKL